MTLQELINKDIFSVVNLGDNLERNLSTPFCCDLLSIAMGKAPADSVWVTVMGNINTVAVASLADVACIVLAEGVELDSATVEKVKSQNITVFATEKPIFDAALTVYQYIHA